MSVSFNRASRLLGSACAAMLGTTGCSQPPPPSAAFLTRADLIEPEACAGCHQDQFDEWSGSMHAYAAEDPVFLAMNRRGQRETKGALGTFCVNCHAPLAVREGATKDGLNLQQLPRNLKGVTCYFCHSIEAVEGTHNDPLRLSGDGVMRASIADPFGKDTFHGAAYSPLLDRDRAGSAAACGSCHDIVSPHGAPIERTFGEWNQSAFSQPAGSTCGQCHMPQSTSLKAVAQVPRAPLRRAHSHAMPAVDVAITPFRDTQRQLDLVQQLLDSTLHSALCVEPADGATRIHVILENVAAGHGFPSGSAQDRRVWVELIAWSGGNAVYSSGMVADGTAITSLPDPDLWLLRDCIFDEAGSRVSMFWEAASYEGNALPPRATFDPADQRFHQPRKIKTYPGAGALQTAPDRITLRVRAQPIGLDVLDDLIASGDLDPRFRAAMPRFTVGGTLEWTQAAATREYVDPDTGRPVHCVTNTNLDVTAPKFPASARSRCKP